MSHMASYKTKLRVNPACVTRSARQRDQTWKLLHAAAETAARDLGGKVVDAVSDYYGRHVPCDLAVVTPGFPRGVGMRVSPSTGDVTFIYDSYGDYRGVAKQVTDAIVQNYTAMAVAKALQALHYDVEYEETSEKPGRGRTVTVRGVM